MIEHFNMFSRYWRTGARRWEAKRYDKAWSRLLYSSLFNRMQYLAFLIEQMPEGSHIIELGCGSGRLFEYLKDKKKLKYSGYDISQDAIEAAKIRWKDYPNATWSCCDISDMPQLSCDLVVSAGLLDWLTDEQIKTVIDRIRAPYFTHSFSKKKKTVGIYVHIAFAFIQSILNKSKYDPRKFTLKEIRKLFSQTPNPGFIENRKLSFGCFVLNLPPSVESDFTQFKIKRYFESKGPGTSTIERLVKAAEISVVKRHLPSLAGKAVLEIGSGTGAYSRLLLNSGVRSLTALDNHVDTSFYIKDPRFRFLLKSSEDLKSDALFNAVVLFGVLEFTNAQKVTDDLTWATAPQGNVFVLYPKERSVPAFIYRKYHELGGRSLNFLTAQGLRDLFEKKGFRQVGSQSAGPVNHLFVFEKLP